MRIVNATDRPITIPPGDDVYVTRVETWLRHPEDVDDVDDRVQYVKVYNVDDDPFPCEACGVAPATTPRTTDGDRVFVCSACAEG